MKSVFETNDADQGQDFEKTIVKRKLIDVAVENEVVPKLQKSQQEWKYKKKNLEELSFL